MGKHSNNCFRHLALTFGLALATSLTVSAQNRALVGRVTDDEGEILVGVTVQEKALKM